MKPILRYTRADRRGYPACAPGSSIHRPGQQVYDHVMPSRKVLREKRSLFNLTEIEIQSLWPSTHLHTYIRYVIPTHESAWSRPILLTQSYTYDCAPSIHGGGEIRSAYVRAPRAYPRRFVYTTRGTSLPRWTYERGQARKACTKRGNDTKERRERERCLGLGSIGSG